MELKLSIIQDPYRGDFIVTFDGLPGCMNITDGQAHQIR